MIARGVQGLGVPAERGLQLTAYTAEPGSPDEEKLALLASWTATAQPSVQPTR